MRKKQKNSDRTLSERQFRILCNEVAAKALKILETSPQLSKRVALVKYLLLEVQARLKVAPFSSPGVIGKTDEETTFFSAMESICNTLTNFKRISINYSCGGIIHEELLNKVEGIGISDN